MTTQTRSFQRRVLDEARRDGYADLYWFIEMAWGGGQRHAPAAYPGRWVPVVPVAPNPDGSRRVADMLADLFRLSNPALVSFAPALTHVESLQTTGCRWYEWTQDVEQDAVCEFCGCVERAGHTALEDDVPWRCVACSCGPVVRRVC